MNKKVRNLVSTLLILISLFGNSFMVLASETTSTTEGVVIDYSVRIRTGPGTNYSQFTINGVAQYYEYGETVTVLGEDTDSDGDTWYKVEFTRDGTTYQQWIYGDYLQIVVDYEYDEDFEEYLDAQGFPESYKEQLRQLHALHPNWTFVAYQTGLDWEEVVTMESRLGYNLISGSNLAYRSVLEGAYDVSTGSFIAYDGTSWYCANSQTISYYLDPRNFLNETNIFMFLDLSFSETQTADVIQALLDGTFMEGTDSVSGLTYAEIFYEAGKQADVSPIYLAVLALQEQGTTGTKCTTGASFTYNSKTYSGLYNFYNIGATSGTDNWKKGLVYANGGESGTNTSYGRPWTSPYKAIVGGALWIADGYISEGQNTMYFQKFNVTPNKTYSHQYMTNVQAAYSQSSNMYATYKDADSLDSNLIFIIPVFENMPDETSLPTTYTLPTTTEEQKNLGSSDPIIDAEEDPEEPAVITGDFIVDLNLDNNDGYLSGFTVGTTLETLTADIKESNSTTTDVTITRSSKSIGDDDIIATGDILHVTDESGTSTYTIVIKGDLNGDGKINLQDLLLMKKDILDVSKVSGAYLQAALFYDSDTITVKDYLVIKKHCLGVSSVSQK